MALIGTAIERKTMASRTRASPTITRPNGSSALLRRSETSIATAVCPVTRMSATLSSLSSAGARARICWTSAAVRGSLCDHSGTTRTRPRSPVGLGVCFVIATTPGNVAMSSARSLTVPLGSVLVITSAVTSSGAL